MAKLVLLSEGFTGKSYELKAESTTVGRLPDNAFEVPEASVSSHHAEILLKGGEVVVRDLDSTNGTFINGQKITESVLKPGQILRLGTIDMRLESGDGASHRPKQELLQQTRVIPQGVKLEDLDEARTTSFEGKTGFEKKSNRAIRLFIALVVVFGLIMISLLLLIVLRG